MNRIGGSKRRSGLKVNSVNEKMAGSQGSCPTFLRKLTRNRGSFPTADSVKKVLYLALLRIYKKVETSDQRLGSGLKPH